MPETRLCPVGLRVCGTDHPLGIEGEGLDLSWQLAAGSARGELQTAYRVLAARQSDPLSDGARIVWDTGRVDSDACVGIPYAGERLEPETRYWWRVQVWDRRGEASEWSAPGWWETGLLDATAWDDAQWIARARSAAATEPPPAGNDAVPSRAERLASYLRREFQVAAPVVRGRLYATALGVYEPYVNGTRVGTDYLCPGWTDYEKRVQYQTYDVTDLLRAGSNAVGAIVADGWFCGHVGMFGPEQYGRSHAFRAVLSVTHEDGSQTRVATAGAWRVSDGPLRYADLLMGETYDARAELGEWSCPGFDDSRWQRAVHDVRWPAPLVSQAEPPVRVTQELVSREPTEPRPGVWVFDLGQDMVGWARLRVRGSTGTPVVLRYAEALNPDGTIHTDNLRTAEATDVYIPAGTGEETYEPRFTYHGFRYVEVTGYPGRPPRDAIRGRVAQAAAPVTGEFTCSDPLLTQLYRNITWSQRGNFLAVPTDCPQRDERLGWTGDIQVFAPTAAFVMDVERFLVKWLRDLADAQHDSGAYPHVAPNPPHSPLGAGAAGWGDAGIVVPAVLHERYGNSAVLEEHYAGMTAWIDYLQRDSQDLIRPADGFGDWLAVNAETPKDVVATAYFAYASRLMAHVASTLGREADADRYRALFARVREAFRTRFVDADVRVEGGTQSAYVLALHAGLLDAEERPRAARHLLGDIELRNGHLSTGFLGTPWLLDVLTDAGRLDVAYRLLRQRTCPSWLYPVTRGATTTWERWDGWTEERGYAVPQVTQGVHTPRMNSFNHYAFGAVADWMVRTVAGLAPAAPGYRRILIRPRTGGGLAWAKAEYESVRGPVRSAWWHGEGRFRLEVTVPPGANATVCLPTSDVDAVAEGGRALRDAEGVLSAEARERCVAVEVGSGEYAFTVPVGP